MDQASLEPAKLGRKLSIETEPKTLLQEEMNSAREAALKVFNSKTKEEALKIFLEGKQPVGAVVEQIWEFKEDTDTDED